MRNIRLTLEYDGTHFSGWQIQPSKRTVQQTLQDVVRKIVNEPVNIIGASRTDAGVHALRQIANFYTKSFISEKTILRALNGLLPKDIAVKKVEKVPLSFHATRKAKKKTYVYLIWNAPFHSPFLNHRAWHLRKPLDLKTMRKASQHLLGRHDFSAFRGANSDIKTSIRTIYSIKIAQCSRLTANSSSPFPLPSREGAAGGRGGFIQIQITANGFLKYMVRNIVGTLVKIGQGQLEPQEVKKILESKDRKKAGVTAPAQGLYLVKVDYSSSGGGF